MKRRVVITGLGVVSPIGVGKDVFWKNILDGVSGARRLDQVTCCSIFGDHEFGAKVVCEASDFDPVAHNVPERYLQEDRFIQFALAAASEAVRDANLQRVDRSRAGVVLATAICGTQTLDREFIHVTEMGTAPMRSGVGSHLYTAAMGDSAAIALATEFGCQGECITLSTGCIGGADAISYAYESIACGDHDVMLSGASEAPITPITLAAFDIINCLSKQPDPTKASRPFCASRDGFVLSEGCGIVILEELEHAQRRGAPIYAEITGCSVTEHATHMTDMSVEGRELARAMVLALQDAHISTTTLDFVNAHGTSTPQNDVCETQAIKTALGEHAYHIPVNSTKSMLGHALAAASAVEIVGCALSLSKQQIHPTIHYDDPDPGCDLDYVPGEARSLPIEWLMTTASGFSGLHAAIVMRKYAEDAKGESAA